MFIGVCVCMFVFPSSVHWEFWQMTTSVVSTPAPKSWLLNYHPSLKESGLLTEMANSKAQAGKFDFLGYLVVPESKKVLKEQWGHVSLKVCLLAKLGTK